MHGTATGYELQRFLACRVSDNIRLV